MPILQRIVNAAIRKLVVAAGFAGVTASVVQPTAQAQVPLKEAPAGQFEKYNITMSMNGNLNIYDGKKKVAAIIGGPGGKFTVDSNATFAEGKDVTAAYNRYVDANPGRGFKRADVQTVETSSTPSAPIAGQGALTTTPGAITPTAANNSSKIHYAPNGDVSVDMDAGMRVNFHTDSADVDFEGRKISWSAASYKGLTGMKNAVKDAANNTPRRQSFDAQEHAGDQYRKIMHQAATMIDEDKGPKPANLVDYNKNLAIIDKRYAN